MLPDQEENVNRQILPFCAFAAELLRTYPTLRAEELANVWACGRSHGDEISRQIQANEAG